jgi:hypothetical protein
MSSHLSSTVQKTVQQRLHKLRRKMANLAQDRGKLESLLTLSTLWDSCSSHSACHGATSATVVDYYSPDQTLVTIPLDPRLSLHDNAQILQEVSESATWSRESARTSRMCRGRTVPGRRCAPDRAGRGLGEPGSACRGTSGHALPAGATTACGGSSASRAAVPDVRVA